MPKSYLDQKLWHKTHFFHFLFFDILQRKNTENLWLINGHLGTISGHFLANYMKIFHKKEVQTVILRCLVCLNLNWIKSYDIILVKRFFFMPENALFQGYFAKVSLGTSYENQLSCFQNASFSKTLWSFHETNNQVKYR